MSEKSVGESFGGLVDGSHGAVRRQLCIVFCEPVEADWVLSKIEFVCNVVS